MATTTISGLTAVTAGNLTGTAVAAVDDANTNTRKTSLAQLRTNVFAGGTGFTAADPLTVGAITATGNSTITGTLGGVTTLTATTVVAALTGNVTGNVSGSSGSTTGNAATATTATTATTAGSCSGNAATATALATPRAINGTNFDGTAPITVTADANTLTNTTLKSTVVTSSLTSVGTLTTLTLSGTLTMAAQTVDQPKLKRYTETVASPSIASNVLTLDCSTANIFNVAVGANITTLTISNIGATGSSQSITLILDYSGTYTIAWPAAVKWNADTAPTLSGNGKRDYITLVTINAGTRWNGFVGLQGATT